MKYSFANLLIQSPKTSLTLGVEQIMLAFINEKNHEQQAYYINKVKNNQYFDLKFTIVYLWKKWCNWFTKRFFIRWNRRY